MERKKFSFKSVCWMLICAAAMLWMPAAAVYADGDLDTTFDPGTGPNNYVYAVAVQPDGKIVIGGSFTTVSGVSRSGIARLNIDGSLDTTFNPGLGASGYLFSIAVQPDGKILIGGGFSTFNSVSRYGVARLNTDGSLDMTFDPGSGASNVYSVVLQPDGKVLIGGNFYRVVNGTYRYGIARLNADGSLDTTFDPGKGADSRSVDEVALQPDGKILIVGGFSTFNSTSRNRIARLNANGFLDTSFDPGIGANDDIFWVTVQSDGKILIGGEFSTFNNEIRQKIARLNADGSLDTSFDPGSGTDKNVYSIAVESDGKILIGGDFKTFNGTERKGIARLNADGSLDTTFDIGAGTAESLYSSNAVKAMALQSDGKIVIGGDFTKFNEITRNKVARLTSDAPISVIRSFSPSCYLAGSKLTVMLTATPAAGTSNYLIEETLPAGWTVSNISHNGTYDSVKKRVKFGPVFETPSQTLTYDLTFPSTETGDKTFSGKVFTDNAISTVTGEKVLTSCLQYHPADKDKNFSLSASEVAAYGSAWKKETTWDIPPNPIPIAYVTRAGMLWQSGEAYKLDTSIGEPPLCWQKKATRSLRDETTANSASSAVRECPSSCLAGQAFTVTLSITPDNNVKSYAVEEDTPPGWKVSSVSNSGEFNDKRNKVKFGLFTGTEARTLTYQVTPPPSATGEFDLSGVASFDGENLEISGNTKVKLGDGAISGDMNSDDKTDLADVILALKISAGFSELSVNLSADMNGDGKIGVEDALCILQKLSM
ncbi:MAG: hypothetical protein BWK80_50465 [Desulfobacteraceae bacterium IS3]|nr:MAG: hypothetical protein BWK80_50465 [Desulfobacteraceae bacterium IS3]